MAPGWRMCVQMIASAAVPARMRVRVIQYRITESALWHSTSSRPKSPHRPCRLVTTLLDAEQYPALELIETFGARWELETTLDEMEVHQRLHDQPLRSQTPRRVLQELYALELAHFMIRALMIRALMHAAAAQAHRRTGAAAAQAHIAPTSLSFTGAVDVIRQAIPLFHMLDPICWTPSTMFSCFNAF